MKKLAILNLLILLCIASYAQIIIDPVADTIELCKGDTTQLEINVTGGTGSYTYSWFPSLGLSDTTIANPDAYPDTTTLYTIIVTDGSSDDTSEVLVIVHEPPVADAGLDQSIPYGTTIMLNGSATGGSGCYFYNWQPDSLLSDTNIIPNPVTSLYLICTQEYNLTVTDSITGCHDEEQMLLVVNGMPPVEITALPNKICLGDTSNLSVFVCDTSLYSYTWTSIPTALNSTEMEVNVSPNDTTIYVLDLLDLPFMWHYYDTIKLPVIHPLLAQFILNVTLNTVSFSNQSQNATTYLWDFGDGDTDTTENPIHFYQNGGNYTIVLYASNECFTDSVQQNIIITDIQINSGNSKKQLTINPNPAKDRIYIDGLKGSCIINLYDHTGRKVIEKIIKNVSGRATLYLNNITSSGHYLIECICNNNVYRQSVIIQK